MPDDELDQDTAQGMPRAGTMPFGAMKQDGDKDILVFGSGSLVSCLSQHRLIDEYRFVVNPLLLGKSQPMLRDMPPAP